MNKTNEMVYVLEKAKSLRDLLREVLQDELASLRAINPSSSAPIAVKAWFKDLRDLHADILKEYDLALKKLNP